eukprot:2530623-Rhodomonas_salina.3
MPVLDEAESACRRKQCGVRTAHLLRCVVPTSCIQLRIRSAMSGIDFAPVWHSRNLDLPV